jgi:hypothetical protein
LLSVFNETGTLSTDFGKILKYQISRNPSSGSRVVPCERTGGRTDGQTDKTKVTVAWNIAFHIKSALEQNLLWNSINML